MVIIGSNRHIYISVPIHDNVIITFKLAFKTLQNVDFTPTSISTSCDAIGGCSFQFTIFHIDLLLCLTLRPTIFDSNTSNFKFEYRDFSALQLVK